MRFYKNAHAFYAGIDLLARTLYLCITDVRSAAGRAIHFACCDSPQVFGAVPHLRDGGTLSFQLIETNEQSTDSSRFRQIT